MNSVSTINKYDVTTELEIRIDNRSIRIRIISIRIKNYMSETLFALESLNEASGPLLRGHVEGDARELTVDVESTLQLEEVPVLHDHLGLGP